MPIFKYKVIDKDGKNVEDTKEFNDKTELYSYLRNIKSTIVSVEEVKNKKIKNPPFSFLKRVKQEEKISFARNLAVMLDAGLALSRALNILEKQSEKKPINKIIKSISNSVSTGKPLSDSLKDHPNIFSNLFVAMVNAGEESGKLSSSLRHIADQLEKAYFLAKKVKGAMIYPSVIMSLMVIIGFLMMVFMVPQLTDTFKGLNVPLPLSTRFLIGVSNFMVSNIMLIIPIICLLLIGFFMFVKSKKGQKFLDFCFLKLPIISNMVREVNSARTSRTLSSLVSSGVNLVDSLRVTENILQNFYFKEVIKKMILGVEKGETMSSIFSENTNLYPIFVSEMIGVGEETGNISVMLENIANFYENEVSEKTKNLSAIIEPFLMVLIGITVGFFAIAMLAPTYSLVDVIGA